MISPKKKKNGASIELHVKSHKFPINMSIKNTVPYILEDSFKLKLGQLVVKQLKNEDKIQH